MDLKYYDFSLLKSGFSLSRGIPELSMTWYAAYRMRRTRICNQISNMLQAKGDRTMQQR